MRSSAPLIEHSFHQAQPNLSVGPQLRGREGQGSTRVPHGCEHLGAPKRTLKGEFPKIGDPKIVP